MFVVQTVIARCYLAARHWVDQTADDERGEITSQTILTAIQVGLALIVGAALTTVVGIYVAKLLAS